MLNHTTVAPQPQSPQYEGPSVSLETLEINQQQAPQLLHRIATLRKKPKLTPEQRRNRRGDEHTSLVRTLHHLGMKDKAADVSSCGRLAVSQCGTCSGLAARVVFSCKFRLCPWCAQTAASHRAKKMAPAVGTFKNPVLITLTVVSFDRLADADAHLRSSWRKMQRRQQFANAFLGGFVFEEATYNRQGGGWHCHLHIIADGFMPQQELSDLWRDVTGDSFIVWIEWVKPQGREKAVKEACKYPTKLSAINSKPHLVLEFLQHFTSRRMCWSWGSARGLLTSDEQADDKPNDQGEGLAGDVELAAHFCPHCGAIGSMSPATGQSWNRADCEPWGGGAWWLNTHAQKSALGVSYGR